MSKASEINYVANVATQLNVPREEFEKYLLQKPFSDQRRGPYLMDIAQMITHLPQPPARLLDIGIGSGWTSKIFGLSGYSVTALDIAPSMIALAGRNCAGLPNVEVHVCDYEVPFDFGTFDCATIYDALHHAMDPAGVIKNIFQALKEGGILVTIEPGQGHANAAESIEAVRKYGTTEKDMPFDLQRTLMRNAGFSEVRQYYRLSALCLHDIGSESGASQQKVNFDALSINTLTQGLTSVVMAVK